ncbi:MAG: Gfo/Idh/MocA family oxidoreductase [Phycisphaerae bacterium]
MAVRKTKIGIIGCGNISGIYFKTAVTVKNLELVGAADLDPVRAKTAIDNVKAKVASGEYKNAAITREPKVMTVKELLAHEEIELVLNLTVPKAHAQIALASLKAGKHTYAEKPFATNRADGKKIMDLARLKKLRVGCAPDTFLGGGHQTCRKLLDDGWIGKPVAATAFMTCHGHESWHPSPEFYYEVGGGPMFDMGPYYLTALVNLLGPAKRVTGFAKATFPTRTITSAAKYGKIVKVETPTHIASTIEFVNGTLVTLIMSFDIWAAELPRIEIYGSQGTLSVPDPNGFGGPVRVARPGKPYAEVPLTHGYADNSRGLGVADMASAILSRRTHRANGDLAFHVLDIMQAALDAQRTGKVIPLTTTCQRPAMLPLGLRDGEID